MKESFDQIEYQKQQVIRRFLGTEEQILKKTQAALKASESGGYVFGTSGFYNYVIESGGRKLTPAEWGICIAKIKETIETIKQEEELRQELRDHDETESRTRMMKGAEELQEQERDRVGLDIEDL